MWHNGPMRLTLLLCSLVVAASAQDWARQNLNKSPRHGEWVSVKHDGRSVEAFVVYPEVSNKATSVIVIHENMGLTDWAREMADEIAGAGFIAIAPDLLSGMGPNGGKTSDFADMDGVRAAFAKLSPDQVTGDLNAVADYVKKLPSANGKLAVVGFCWGGGNSFRFATNRPDLSAAFVFYGTPPSAADMARIKAPVYGFYGGNDARVTATVPTAEAAMKEAGKKYEPVTYEGAGHGFMRAGEDPSNTNEANKKARDEGFKRLTELLKKL